MSKPLNSQNIFKNRNKLGRLLLIVLIIQSAIIFTLVRASKKNADTESQQASTASFLSIFDGWDTNAGLSHDVPMLMVTQDNQKVLYKGMDNPLTINVSGSSSEIQLKPSRGLILKDLGNHKFMAIIEGSPETVFVEALVEHNGVLISAGKQEFKVSAPPEIYVRYGDIVNPTCIPVEKAELIEQEGLQLMSLNSSVAIDRYSITKFRFIYDPVDAPASLISSSGPKFRENMINVVTNAENFDRILIEGVTIKDNITGELRDIKPLMVTVRAPVIEQEEGE